MFTSLGTVCDDILDPDKTDEPFQRRRKGEGGAAEVPKNGAGPDFIYRLLRRAVSSLDHLLYLVILPSASKRHGKPGKVQI